MRPAVHLGGDAEQRGQPLRRQHLRFRPVGEHAPSLQHHDALDLGDDLADVVRHEHDPHAGVGERGHRAEQRGVRGDVERIARLVEQQRLADRARARAR